MSTVVNVPVPPRPKEPKYIFDLVAALRKDAPPEARALALLVMSGALNSYAQELESQRADSPIAVKMRNQANAHARDAANLLP
jgi:hypothetical protein